MRRLLGVLALCALAAGCAARPVAQAPSRDDQVVLLPGADGKTGALTVTHAGNAYTGMVQRNGSFVTIPKAVGGASETHTLTITGTFTTTAIDATVVAVVQRPGSADCQYTVKWVGPKQGEPNVIPGG